MAVAESISLEFDKDLLVSTVVAYNQSNDTINGTDVDGTSADDWTNLFNDNDDIRLALAEILYDAYVKQMVIND